MRYGSFLTIMTVLLLFGTAHAQTGDDVLLVSDNEADMGIASLLNQVTGIEYFTTPWGEYDGNVSADILATEPGTVVIIGGTAAVPGDYEDALLTNASVERLQGETRYETAVAVLNYFNDTFNGSKIILVTGDDIDGINESVDQAAEEGVFILYIKEDEVPDEVTEALNETNTTEVEVVLSPNSNETEINETIEEDTDADVGKVTRGDPLERADSALERAREAVAEMDSAMEGLDVEKGSLGVTAELARNALQEAESAYAEGKHGEAYGRANEAYRHAKNTMRKVAKLGKAGKTTGALKKKLPEMIGQVQSEIDSITEYLQTAGNDTGNITALLDDGQAALDEASAAVDAGDYGTAMDSLDEAKALVAQAAALAEVDVADFTVYKKKKTLEEKKGKLNALKSKGKGKNPQQEQEQSDLEDETGNLENEIADMEDNMDT